MKEQEKEQIRTLRSIGYSYQQIADILGMKRSTVSSFCLRYGIEAPEKTSIIKEGVIYKQCHKCNRLFVTSDTGKQFCSDKCRVEYWRTEQKDQETKEEKKVFHQTLRKELDLLAKKSDELVGGIILCRRRE